MEATEAIKRGRGRPRKNALASFAVKVADFGDVTVTVSAPSNAAADITAIEGLAKAVRAHISKNVKGASPNAITVRI